MPYEPLDPDGPVDYLIGHLEEALACDPRVSENGLHVTISARRVFIDGTVSTKARFDAVGAVVNELLPDWTVCNQAAIADGFPEPTETEALS